MAASPTGCGLTPNTAFRDSSTVSRLASLRELASAGTLSPLSRRDAKNGSSEDLGGSLMAYYWLKRHSRARLAVSSRALSSRVPSPVGLRRYFRKDRTAIRQGVRQWLAYATFAQYLPDRASNPRVVCRHGKNYRRFLDKKRGTRRSGRPKKAKQLD
jgi:hypothetical protein